MKIFNEQIARPQTSSMNMFHLRFENISRQLVEQASEDRNLLISMLTELLKEISMRKE